MFKLYIYIYIYIYRERERERDWVQVIPSVTLSNVASTNNFY